MEVLHWIGITVCTLPRIHLPYHCSLLEETPPKTLIVLLLQDAKELLYRLFRAGFVAMQEIPRTADHAPSRTLYTWRVDAAAAAEKLAAELYKAALNVRLRLEHEKKEQADVSHAHVLPLL